MPSPAELDVCQGIDLNRIKLAQVAFFGAASLAKHGSQIQNINAWIHKRIPAFYNNLGILTPQFTPDYSNDLIMIGKYLESQLILRAALYKPFLYKTNIPENELPNPRDLYYALRMQLQMILQFYSLTSFNLSLSFAIACETEAHLFEEIVDQSLFVIDQKRKLMDEIEQNGNLYEFDYY